MTRQRGRKDSKMKQTNGQEDKAIWKTKQADGKTKRKTKHDRQNGKTDMGA